MAGCSADDIQLNGKVFDAVGHEYGSSTNREAPKLKARSGIVVPPNLSILPEPGSGKAGEPGLELQDYDEKRIVSHDQLERQQQAILRQTLRPRQSVGRSGRRFDRRPARPLPQVGDELIKQTQDGEE